MSNILVTGSSGFIGRALVERMRQEGHIVCEFDIEHGDIALPDSLTLYSDFEIEHVFHLAGRTFVPESWADPYNYFKVNLLGTVNVLEFCRKSTAALTFLSSYVYGEPIRLPIDEKHPLQSYNPYSHSKIIAESTCHFYAQNFKIPVTVIRPFNVYGPNQPTRFLIPEIISKVFDLSIDEIEVLDLKPKRDFVYLDDLIDALILSITKPRGTYNIANGFSKSVEEIIIHVMKLAGISKPYRALAATRQNEIFDLYADISLASSVLNWRPRTSFEDGIMKCINAFIANSK